MRTLLKTFSNSRGRKVAEGEKGRTYVKYISFSRSGCHFKQHQTANYPTECVNIGWEWRGGSASGVEFSFILRLFKGKFSIFLAPLPSFFEREHMRKSHEIIFEAFKGWKTKKLVLLCKVKTQNLPRITFTSMPKP
jgi:hypothetical protein